MTVLFLVTLTFCFVGCGGSSGGGNEKKEVQALHAKYLNALDQVFIEMQNEPDHKDWSKEFVQSIHKYTIKFKTISDNIEQEKISKKAESYKTALKKYCLNIYTFFDLAEKQIIYDLEKKPQKDIDEIGNQAEQEMKNVSQNFYELENEYSKVVYGKPATVMGVNGVNYLTYTASNVDIAVIDVKNHTKAIGDNPYYQQKPIGKFLIVKVFIKNNQKDAITVDSNSFKIVDKENREYSVSTHGQTAYRMGKEDSTKGFLTQLNPNMGTDFTFVFDVPHEINQYNSKLQATGGFKGKKVIMPLKPIKIITVKQ